MNQLSIKEIVTSKYPNFLNSYPAFIKNYIYYFFEKLLYIKKINAFLSTHNDKQGIELIDELFEYLDVSYSVSNKDRNKIPSEGKIFIVANHPLGGLDGLILLKLISETRSNVKIIANDMLMNISNLSNYFLPYDLFSKRSFKKNYEVITDSIKNEDAIIIFPAGEVARLTLSGIKDNKWKKGVIHFSDKYEIPILPIFIKGRNSILFYLISLLSKSFSMFLLPHEVFNKRGKTFQLQIGDYIPSKAVSTKYQRIEYLIKSLKKHLYLISKNKKGIFETEKNVIHPVPAKVLKKQLFDNEYLGDTNDGKKIFIVDFNRGKDVIKEISRLREITFRRVGEGTGYKNDSDIFDKYYKHLVLWDENKLEIIGSYRLGFGRNIFNEYGENGFYTSTLFDYSNNYLEYLNNSIELGRSFIQAKYWNSLALDYLWQGIGKVITRFPEVKYLFGAVSLSNNYSLEAKNLLVFFYTKWFSKGNKLVKAKTPFLLSENINNEMREIFSSDEFSKDFLNLKSRLKILGFTIPTLYKQYSDLCEPGGVQFVDFNVDAKFNNCIDAFILIDINKIKLSKRERYLTNNYKFINPDIIKRQKQLS